MAVSKKHNRSVSSKSGRYISNGRASGDKKTAGDSRITSHSLKAASSKQEAAAPLKALILSNVIAIEHDVNTPQFISPQASGTVIDELKLTIATKEELENSRISAYRYIL